MEVTAVAHPHMTKWLSKPGRKLLIDSETIGVAGWNGKRVAPHIALLVADGKALYGIQGDVLGWILDALETCCRRRAGES